MKSTTLIILTTATFLFTACLESESKNHPPYEPTVQSDEQKIALKKLVDKAEANYNANKKSSTH